MVKCQDSDVVLKDSIVHHTFYIDMSSMLEGKELTADTLQILTIQAIRTLVAPQLVVPRSSCEPKAVLVEWIVTHADSELSRILHAACAEKRADREIWSAAKKRKRSEHMQTQRKSARMEVLESHDAHDITRYMDVSSEAVFHQCSREYIEATSDAAVKLAVCAVCAREVGVKDDTVSVVPLADIPNQSRLIPLRSHPEHDLYHEMLLEPNGVHTTPGNDDAGSATLCGCCHDQLNKDCTPIFSLANGLWIGRIPWELTVLTVPEQLLVAQLYPRVYVFKLYPKDPHVRPHQATLQSGMRGNVSTYDQDLSGIASMVEGRLMPRPLEILSSVITVTFIGKNEPQKHWFRSLFRVRRDVVHNALKCLKAINPYYADVKINPDRLNALPEDGIPDEIAELMRHTNDTGLVDAESSGYVPEHQDNDNRGESPCGHC